MSQEVFYTVDQVASMLGIERHSVIRLITTRKMSAVVVGRLWRITQTNIDDYVKKFTVKANS